MPGYSRSHIAVRAEKNALKRGAAFCSERSTTRGKTGGIFERRKRGPLEKGQWTLETVRWLRTTYELKES